MIEMVESGRLLGGGSGRGQRGGSEEMVLGALLLNLGPGLGLRPRGGRGFLALRFPLTFSCGD